MVNDRILENIRIIERGNTWFAEKWDGEKWVHIHSSESYEQLVFWLDWNHPHPNIDTRASD